MRSFISASEASELAVKHMAALIHAEPHEGKWVIDECRLSAFFHDSDWYPEGLKFTINGDIPLVYRAVVQYKSPGRLSKHEVTMIISVDAETGAFRGYQPV
ncbi:hypothetical protein [Alicyclobacillus acidoterrestris]|uniref:Uncharacterized protein n=1 Tax=Alicyclobacillus acidoterrestris (strain ATCC 49025 / DSM 3922 / CIP 106132 / NCIMB 13137 / GD3B) TaxID=1356854 RepID=T0CGP6_ALIAG|nr:hypothetical protein [Alicyclobacillus acidoterrestris]EPZ51660.1 hypothetical protein N007_20650 [Alicyclobacillus acidoterrestris ATCC 49025]UNO48282.1 hypothetical protein K1I37_16640 [Alicyclobacillus acidoterrestris]